MTTNPEFTNRLIHSTSPYLMQHAHNPVDWYPWEDEAWSTAKNTDKLVIVSVGYSACHWCHVMAHECFEDPSTADVMNRHYINIKVDREERPDVDMVYMDACQLMTGRGGWPLNAICLPDGRPVYAGTYFPREKWKDILLQIQTLYETDRAKLLDYATQMQHGLRQMNLVETLPSDTFTRATLAGLFETMEKQFDWEEGGQNRAPKFPMPNILEYVLDEYQTCGNPAALDFAQLTLLKMANGGIYDHLRGGFCRYSTDGHWFAPHFEKMLYDNAQLAALYSRAYAITGAPLFLEVAEETRAFCRNELLAETGGYMAALDADSEGMEGRFYVFTLDELSHALTEEELQFARILYGIAENGNWEHGFNILHKPLAPLQLLEKTGLDAVTYTRLCKEIKSKLTAAQNQRIRPGLDFKIIAAWNGLMLTALAKVADFTRKPQYLEDACNLGHWIWSNMQAGGRLFRIYSQGKAHTHGFLEDYACVAEGYLNLFETTGDYIWLEKADTLLETSIRLFYDADAEIFYFTPGDGESLIIRKADLSDDVINSANSILGIALQKMGVLLGKSGYNRIATGQLKAVRQQVTQYPGWYSNWARLASIEAIGLVQMVCTGPDAAEYARQLRAKVPSWCLVVASTAEIPLLAGKGQSGQTLVYVCADQTCFEPVNSTDHAVELVQDWLGVHP
ncbi:MAG: thioredoxin domain-containing protein [Bacteroidetes bacterium]|nr:thioredoxin domain-containing protein [Bacteroidota bacterium]